MASSNAFTVDTSDLVKYAKRMAQAADPNLNREFGKALKVSAEPIVATAKTMASWSSRIPGTIRALGGATKIVIRAGGGSAPHAAAYEHRGMPGKFRHPVFGNRKVWVDQAARPFLGPALEANHGTIGTNAEAAIMTVLHDAGYS